MPVGVTSVYAALLIVRKVNFNSYAKAAWTFDLKTSTSLLPLARRNVVSYKCFKYDRERNKSKCSEVKHLSINQGLFQSACSFHIYFDIYICLLPMFFIFKSCLSTYVTISALSYCVCASPGDICRIFGIMIVGHSFADGMSYFGMYSCSLNTITGFSVRSLSSERKKSKYILLNGYKVRNIPLYYSLQCVGICTV